ncbi:hypothetical protein H5410_032328 [Solanum commersonii]|uniref:Uncharacterized protein n=1 Tax=Solanum commersonii TaxID=4109 RepID=A0A9J5YQ11_SOLCO|nr:hypothetical protein H5410_032328 [Solanum commersonii]
MTTSSGTECNLYCLILLFRAITCKVGQIICRSLIITEAEFGKPEAEADSAFTFLRQAWILLAISGGSGILVVPVRDPLSSARGPKLAPNGRAMVFMSMPRETLPLPLGATKTLYIKGLPSHSFRREGARTL